MKRVNLSEIVSEALRILKPSLSTDVRLNSDIEAHAGWVKAEPFQIHQIVLNLCRNSAQAMNHDGPVTVSLKTLKSNAPELSNIRHQPGRKLACLKVMDGGPGMDPDTWMRSIEPFRHHSGKKEGSGLGISIVHRLAEALGGSVRCEQVKTGGTVISVYLPVEL